METKFIFEDGSSLTPGRQAKLIKGYHDNNTLKLPEGFVVRSIQGISDPKTNDLTTIIIIGLNRHV